MITHKSGNLIHDDAEAWVNPVNCVGVMGGGLAAQFKKINQGNFLFYSVACRQLQLNPGEVLPYRMPEKAKPGDPSHWILNAATKDHWKDPSRMGWIISAISNIAKFCMDKNIKSCAVPMLGCGLGGLDHDEVLELMEIGFGWSTTTEFRIYSGKEKG